MKEKIVQTVRVYNNTNITAGSLFVPRPLSKEGISVALWEKNPSRRDIRQKSRARAEFEYVSAF